MRAKTKRLAPSARQGEIVEVLSENPGRYVVRWDDGRTTSIAPLPDSIRIEPAKTAKPKQARSTRARKR